MTNPALPPFDGQPVTKASARIVKAGDGLSAALGVDPVAMLIGTRHKVLIDVVVDHVDHKPVVAADPGGDLDRTHILRALRATVIAGGEAEVMAQAALDDQQRRVDEARGVKPLPFGEAEDLTLDPDGDNVTPIR